MKTFESMDLFAALKKALREQQYVNATPIQAETIPAAVAGQDVLGCAQTGTGKTAAFALPILDYLGHDQPRAKPNRPTALVLAPTRELAIQISDSFRVYGKHIQFRQALVYGGVGQQQQVRSLRRGTEVLIATPGRLQDLMDQGHVDLSHVEVFVLDEADRMLDMGFLPALKKIIARLPKQRQSLFFSATLPPRIRELAASLLFNPVTVDVTPKSPSVKKIAQQIVMLDRQHKLDSLQQILGASGTERAIVFTRTKHGANALAKKLERNGVGVSAIHGNKTQNARQKTLQAFRQNRIQVLVATDVAARGIDIDGVTHVINFDMPVEPESYVHRIGRTGRAGAAGVAISFCTSQERSELRAIEKLIGMSLPVEDRRSGDEADEPRGRDRQQGRRGGPASKRHSGRRRQSTAAPRAGRQAVGSSRGSRTTPKRSRRGSKRPAVAASS